jgi:lipid-A-disaccharide synthase
VTVQSPKIMLVAGEPSGDRLGASLMGALKRRLAGATFVGVGGTAMTAEGLKSAVPIDDLAVMGLVEVIPRIPRLARHIRNTAAQARREHPDVLVTIDAPGFNFRLARRLANTDIPRVHYVAPSVWAWKPGRAKKIAPLFDHLLALLPFEPPYFEAVGLPTTFVGHPAVEHDQPGDATGFRKRYAVSDDTDVLVVLPGSRKSEVERLLPIFAETVQRVCANRPNLRIVVPTVEHVRDAVSQAVQRWPGAPIVVAGEEGRRDAFATATAALAASGTVSVELALAGVPAVIAYDVNKITAAIAKRLVKTDHVSLVNILLKRAAVPEYLLGECRVDLLAPAVARLLDDPEARETQRQAYRAALDLLKPPDGLPSAVAADVVISLLKQKAAA